MGIICLKVSLPPSLPQHLVLYKESQECRPVQPFWRAIRYHLDKLNMWICYDPAISPLGICPRAHLGLTYVDGHYRFVCGGRDLGGTGCPSWGEGTGKIRSVCTMGCYAAARSRLDVYIVTWKDPLAEKVKYRMRAMLSLLENWMRAMVSLLKNASMQNNDTYFVRTYSNKKTPTRCLPIKGRVMQAQCGARRD